MNVQCGFCFIFWLQLIHTPIYPSDAKVDELCRGVQYTCKQIFIAWIYYTESPSPWNKELLAAGLPSLVTKSTVPGEKLSERQQNSQR